MKITKLIFISVIYFVGLVNANERMARYQPDYHQPGIGSYFPNRPYDHGYQYGNNYYAPQRYPSLPYANATFNYYVTWIPVTVNYTNITLNASSYDYFVGRLKIKKN